VKKPLIYLAGIALFFILGVLVFNFLVMPLLVRSGQAITVPDVCGKDEAEAESILKEARLKVSIEAHRFDPVIAKGKIVIQEPLPGRKVKAGRTVGLVVSKGVEKVELPYILGLELEKARQILDKYDIQIKAVDSIFNDSVPEGRIASANPWPGEEVPKGSKVSVTVSLGKGVAVPDLSGLKIEEATNLIREKALSLGEVKEIEGSGEPGTIMMQAPGAGTLVQIGDSVSLVVVKKK